MFTECSTGTTLDKKKEPSPRFAARRTLFDLAIILDHERSAQGKVRSATICNFCPALIALDRAWYHTWNSVLIAANLEKGSFFFLSRVVATAIECMLASMRVAVCICLDMCTCIPVCARMCACACVRACVRACVHVCVCVCVCVYSTHEPSFQMNGWGVSGGFLPTIWRTSKRVRK